MLRAAQGYVSQGFHADHKAVDIAGAFGSPILAPVSGFITAARNMGDAGLAVQIGDETNGHRLCHNNAVHVSAGQWVEKGQHIADMGYTGKVIPAGIDGTHLHWIMWKDGTRVNPLDYVAPDTPPAPQINKGNELMTPNFIRRTYYMVNKQYPTQQEVDFHMAKSNPESFINGFGDNAYWMALESQVQQLNARIADLDGNNARQTELIVQLTAERDALQAALDKATIETTPYTFTEDVKMVRIDSAAPRLNLREQPDTNSPVYGEGLADGAIVATLGYVADGGDVNGNKKWFKTLDGKWFTAAYATVQGEVPAVEQTDTELETELDNHIEQLQNDDWRKLDPTFNDTGLYEAVQDVTVYDYSNQASPVELKVRMKLTVVGRFWRLGVPYYLTEKSHDSGLWRGVPVNAVKLIKRDTTVTDLWTLDNEDDLFDLNTYKEAAAKATEVVKKANVRTKLFETFGSIYGTIKSIANKLSFKKQKTN